MFSQTLAHGTAIIKYYYYSFVFDKRSFGKSKDYFASRKKQEPFGMAIGNVELMHACSPENMYLGTAKMK